MPPVIVFLFAFISLLGRHPRRLKQPARTDQHRGPNDTVASVRTSEHHEHP
jgi:thiosulfate reductase cytochrome b subunit